MQNREKTARNRTHAGYQACATSVLLLSHGNWKATSSAFISHTVVVHCDIVSVVCCPVVMSKCLGFDSGELLAFSLTSISFLSLITVYLQNHQGSGMSESLADIAFETHVIVPST